MYPGSPGKCPNGKNTYDPRKRPWYVAASSGPKDVILILDTSGSMRDYNRMVRHKDVIFQPKHLKIKQYGTLYC